MFQLNQAGEVPSYPASLCDSGPPLISWRPPTLGRTISLTQFTDSNVDPTQKHLHRHTRNNV